MLEQDILLNGDFEKKHQFVGMHVLAELYGADPIRLEDTNLINNAIIEGVKQSGAHLCDIVTKKFQPIGCTIVAVLSESHVSIHTYPEIGAAFVDAFTCGTLCNPKKITKHIFNVLGAKRMDCKEIYRGKFNINGLE